MSASPFFNLSLNTDALSTIFSSISDRFDKLEQRAKLYEDRSLQMLDALTEATQRLTVSETQYAAVYDTVSTLQKMANDLAKNKLDRDDHIKTVARLDDQVGQVRMHIEVVDSRKQEVDIPGLMKRVSQEARDNSAKILIERETEQRRSVEALVVEKNRILAEDVNKKTEKAVKIAETSAEQIRKDFDERTGDLSRRIDSVDMKCQTLATATEAICAKILVTENNIDALSDLVKDDVSDARQLVGCVCLGFNVNVDALISSVSASEKSALSSDNASESNTLRHWKWERSEVLRKQAVVNSWTPVRNIHNQEFTKKFVVPTSHPPVADMGVAMTKRDEAVRHAGQKRRELMITTQQQQQQQAKLKQQQQQQEQDPNSDSTENNNSISNKARIVNSNMMVVTSDAGKLFLESPILTDVETRAVDALRSDLSVIQQKVMSDSLTQIQQLDKVVRSKISFDRAQALVNEAAGVAADKSMIPVKDAIDGIRRTMLTTEAGLALLSEKVSHSDLLNLVQPAIDEAGRSARLASEVHAEGAVLGLRTAMEKQVAGLKERCGIIEGDVAHVTTLAERVDGEVHAIQLRAAGSIEGKRSGGSGGEESRCLSCGTDLAAQHNKNNNQNQNQSGQGCSANRPPSASAAANKNKNQINHNNSILPNQDNNNNNNNPPNPQVVAVLQASHNNSARVLASSVDDTSNRHDHHHHHQSANNISNHTPPSGVPLPPPPSASAHQLQENNVSNNNQNSSLTTLEEPGGRMSRSSNNNNNNSRMQTPTPPLFGTANNNSARNISNNQQQQQQRPANWYQQMDDAFQMRSFQNNNNNTNVNSDSAASQQQQQPAQNRPLSALKKNHNSNNTSGLHGRPTGAWSSMSKDK